MRLAADAAHGFGGSALDRGKPLTFKLDGRAIDGFEGDSVLSAVLAAGIDTYGRLDEAPIALTEAFAPPVSVAGSSELLPMERLAATNGAELTTQGPRTFWPFGAARSLRQAIGQPATPPWARESATETLEADLAIIGAGLAGLAAAEAALTAGKTIVLIERRRWIGGDADYFGPVGDEESPETIITRLGQAVGGSTNGRLLLGTDALQIVGQTVYAHQLNADAPRGRMMAIKAGRILLATGAPQRLPLFAGNRVRGVLPAVTAYRFARHFGVAPAKAAVVATQSNFGYRLALHLNDAGVAIERIVDTRVNPQSRFIDFAKASGLKLSTGQLPIAALVQRHALAVSLANVGTSDTNLRLETPALIVSGAFQPELSLWMLAGGMVQWSKGRLMHSGALDRVAIAGSAAGWRSHQATIASGRAAQAALFGERAAVPAETELSAVFETPDGATPIAPVSLGATFLDHGATLVKRPAVVTSETSFAPRHALGVGDVAAAVDLGLISPTDAGAVAEERGAPGGDLAATTWAPPPRQAVGGPAFLAGRFGENPERRHLITDVKRSFSAGALVYAPGAQRLPASAIGIIVEAASPGGIALLDATAAQEHDRFVVEMLEGPSPARFKPS